MSALAVLAESLLFQMDELLTTDDVHGGSMLLAGVKCMALLVDVHGGSMLLAGSKCMVLSVDVHGGSMLLAEVVYGTVCRIPQNFIYRGLSGVTPIAVYFKMTKKPETNHSSLSGMGRALIIARISEKLGNMLHSSL